MRGLFLALGLAAGTPALADKVEDQRLADAQELTDRMQGRNIYDVLTTLSCSASEPGWALEIHGSEATFVSYFGDGGEAVYRATRPRSPLGWPQPFMTSFEIVDETKDRGIMPSRMVGVFHDGYCQNTDLDEAPYGIFVDLVWLEDNIDDNTVFGGCCVILDK